MYALGDFVAVLDSLVDHVDFLARMLSVAMGGTDVVFAHNEQSLPQSLMYRLCYQRFYALYKWFTTTSV
ncbi:hypothetical protein KQH49_03170 [Mycetohabitans sp. B5]|uniref:hypothetical protein n=1 Tax=Mycetohabitans TaxID=2571159 RepID=UPI000CE4BD42|nr:MULTISPECIES: hypothetical protein [Mycetohabitans]MCG1054017.1 hypothetical protein [Mycetohabitans sp. B5]